VSSSITFFDPEVSLITIKVAHAVIIFTKCLRLCYYATNSLNSLAETFVTILP